MAAVQGQRFLADPEGEAKRFVEQLESEAAAQSLAPPRYEKQAGYWCVVKTGTWPNVTGWAEHRQAQRIYTRKLKQLKAAGIRKGVMRRASADTQAEMLARTAERKEASDRFYAQFDAAAAQDAGTGAEPATTPTD